ncbi:MAG: fasciclin domain-containing protein [Heteroscytonema crispum UTEX LB 1556]
MKHDYSKYLTKFAGMVGVTGIGILMTLPAGAKEALNPNPGIFAEAPYSRTQRIEINTQYTPAEPVQETAKNKKPQRNVSQKAGGGTNPSPSILQECPYNRSACDNRPSNSAPLPPATTPPEATPTPPPTEVPTGTPPTPPEGTGTPPTPPEGTGTPPTSPGTGKPPTEPGAATPGKNLLALAEGNSQFTMLTKALKAAGLTETLQGKDNLTIFAPTDAAFAKLPADAVRDLLKPENKEVLVKLMTYHVVKGQVLSTDLKSGEVKSLEGGAINVKVDPATGVMVNDAKVVEADIKGTNGVIHAIDQVILPPDL